MAVEMSVERVRVGWAVLAAGLLCASGGIHLRLWLEGYRSLPTIGPLFLAQVVSCGVLGLAVALSRWRGLLVASVVLLAGTATGYVVSVTHGLFGLHDTLSSPWGPASLAVEGAGSLLLLVEPFLRVRHRSRNARLSRQVTVQSEHRAQSVQRT